MTIRGLAVVVLAFAPVAHACSPSMLSIEEKVAQASGVYLAIVTGERRAAFERAVLHGEDPSLVPIPDERILRVVLTETLFGPAVSLPVEATVSCGSPKPKIYEGAIVYRDENGAYWADVKNDSEVELRNAVEEKRRPTTIR